MVVGTLQDGLDLSILTNNILKTNNLVVNGLTLHYDPRESSYKYVVRPLNKEYIEMDKDWFSHEINLLLDYAKRNGDSEHFKTKLSMKTIPCNIPLSQYVNSINLQLAVDVLLSESDFQTTSQGIYLVSKMVKGEIVLNFWYREIRKRVFLWK